MSASELQQALRNRGKLYVNVTDLNGAAPYGGQEMGLIKAVAIDPAISHKTITAVDDFGGMVIEGILKQNSVIISFIARGQDKVIWENALPNTVSTGPTNRPLFRVPHPEESPATSFQSGFRTTSRAIVLAFVPDDEDNHLTAVMNKCIIMPEETAELDMATDKDFEMALVALVVPLDNTKDPFQLGRRKDLELYL